MYKTIIVDDENLIREGLKNIIDWESLNITILDTAQNGKEALEIFKKNPVDIIITDINMPLVNGIDLLKQIKYIDKNVKFIILSGYEDFTYAKEAISIGVEAYILKPIDEEELLKVLKDIVTKLDEYKNIKNINIKKDIILKNILNKKSTKKDLIDSKEKINIKLDDSLYVVSTLLIKQGINSINFKYIEKTEVLYDDYGNLILINSFDKNTDLNEIKKFYEDILEDIRNKYNYDILISVGRIVDDINMLNKSFKISNLVRKNILISGFNKCLTEEDLLHSRDIQFENEINEISRLIINNDIEAVNKYIDDLLDNQGLTPKNIYNFATKILILYDNLKTRFKIDNEDNLGDSIINVLNLTKLEEIKKYIKEKLVYLIEYIADENIKLSPIVRRIVKCVNENYNKDLSLKTLALEYNVNTSYLGQVFTKEIGIQFSDYLNKVRNSVAKDLILNTNKKISDISKEVGYLDTSYFYRKFKKYYGVTPATLRELQNY
ncbi:response regulator transcription factor [[Clostridium] colinum]|uniref:response regulator transcription factor n=1 Tax=[Clostridium] colinum TaxID=36835 RepID=UPI0020244C37|nr:response regulator [[Clostridium] colinum]